MYNACTLQKHMADSQCLLINTEQHNTVCQELALPVCKGGNKIAERVGGLWFIKKQGDQSGSVGGTASLNRPEERGDLALPVVALAFPWPLDSPSGVGPNLTHMGVTSGFCLVQLHAWLSCCPMFSLGI
jgi:hypothetical protein